MSVHAAPRKRAARRRSTLLAVVVALGLATLAPVFMASADSGQNTDHSTSSLYACLGRQLNLTRDSDSAATLTCMTRLSQVGPAAAYTGRRSGTARTTVPDSTDRQTLLLATVLSSRSSTVTMPGWTKVVDKAAAHGRHLTAWWRIGRPPNAQATAKIAPASAVSMTTRAFIGYDKARPVAPAGTTTAQGQLRIADVVLVRSAQSTSSWPDAIVIAPGGTRRADCGQAALTYRQLRKTLITIICTSSGEPVPTPTSTVTTTPPATTPPATTPPATTPPTTAPATTPPPTVPDPTTSSEPPATVPAGSAPTSPTKVCDTAGLAGPASPPAGAVTVTPAQNLGDVVDSHGNGTTYWLAPGIYKLGTGVYDQVIPHSGDHFIGAPGAIVDGQRKNNYAFTGTVPNVTIEHLTIQNFTSPGDEGVVNHDQGRGWTIAETTIQANGGAGVMLGTDDHLLRSCLRNNGQYGFQGFSMNGASNITMTGNEISGNNTDDWERRQPGCGCSGGGKFWEVKGATVTDNYVHDNHGVGLWADTNNSGFLFKGNYIADNDGEGLMYEASYNAALVDNTFVRNAVKNGATSDDFANPAVYISESGSDPRAPGPYGSSFDITGNVFVDNWSGIILWENADRFAGSPANSSTGTTTMVDPAATVQACATASLIAGNPYFNDCRWKTQRLNISDNTFSMTPSHIPGCTPAAGCGWMGVFSQYGTTPSWSPYKAYVVPDNITFHQGNLWKDNTYSGAWHFMAHTLGNEVTWGQWRAAPYAQDAGSTLG